MSRENVLSISELVLVQRVVFNCCAVQQRCSCGGFQEQAAAGIDANLRVGRVFDVVVGGPEPDIFEVEAGGAGSHVEGLIGGDTGRFDGAGGGGGGGRGALC